MTTPESRTELVHHSLYCTCHNRNHHSYYYKQKHHPFLYSSSLYIREKMVAAFIAETATLPVPTQTSTQSINDYNDFIGRMQYFKIAN